MSDYYKNILLIYALAIVISLIWFGIHYVLKRKEKSGTELSAKEKQWMGVSKIAGYLFLILPIPILLLPDFGFVTILLLIGIPGALISFLKKGK